MAFTAIEKGLGKYGRKRLENTVSVTVQAAGTSFITLSGDVVQRLGNPPYVKVMLGSGEHSGFIALIPRNMPGETSYKMLKNGGQSGHTKRLAIYAKKIGLVIEKTPVTTVPFEITEDGLIVDLRPLQKHRASRPSLALNSALVAAE